RINLITRVRRRTSDVKIGLHVWADRIVTGRAPASVRIGQNQIPIVRKIMCRVFVRLGSGKEKLWHRCVTKTGRKQARRSTNLSPDEFIVFRRWIERAIAPEQFLHNGRPEWRGRPDGKRIAHWSSVEIACPNGDGVLFVVTNSPGVAEPAACSGFCRN